MDSFRDVSVGDCDIYVIDSVTGHTKAVVDRFYSLIWTERFAECGEFELSGPEDTVWAGVIAEGDYLHFTASSTGKGGRYTMVVESRYTSWDAETGYTVYANGRSLDSLLDRRINMGLIKYDPTDWKAYEEYKWYALSGAAVTPDNTLYWPHKRNPTADKSQYYPLTDQYVVSPMPIQSVDSTLSPSGHEIVSLIYQLIEFNMGPSAKPSRQFGSTFETYRPAAYFYDDRDPDTGRYRTVKDPFTADELVDGKFDNVYDIITDLLSQTARRKNALGERITGEMRQVSEGSAETVFHMTFEVYQGRDLTIGNKDGNEPVIFSKDWDNAITLEYVHGEANLKNSLFYDTGLRYTPADIYELEQLITSLDLENQAISIEMSYPEPPEYPKQEDHKDDWDDALEQYNESLENYNEQMRRLEQLKTKMDKHIERLNREIKTRDEELARPGLTDQQKEALNKRKTEDTERRDKLQYRRGQINENHEIKTPDNADDATKKANDKKEKERQKALKAEQESISETSKLLQDRKERLEQEDDNLGYEEVYYGTYGRDYANPAWTTEDWGNADQGPVGFDRREMYMQKDPVDWMSQKWTGRFGEYQYDQDDNGNDIAWYPDWGYFCESMHKNARVEIRKDDNSREDTLEATVNYNVMFRPTVDYNVGDRVTVMGMWNNETVREMRCKEMVYSVDSSGFTIVPSFVLLEEDENKGA